MIDCDKETLVKAAQTFMADIEKEKSCQTIFGSNSDKLQYFISRGWTLERFVEGLSLKQEKYTAALPSVEEVGNFAVRQANELGVAEVN